MRPPEQALAGSDPAHLMLRHYPLPRVPVQQKPTRQVRFLAEPTLWAGCERVHPHSGIGLNGFVNLSSPDITPTSHSS